MPDHQWERPGHMLYVEPNLRTDTNWPPVPPRRIPRSVEIAAVSERVYRRLEDRMMLPANSPDVMATIPARKIVNIIVLLVMEETVGVVSD